MAKGFNSRGRGGMPPMGGGMNANMMKQVQKMQQDMLRMQEELEAKSYTAAAERCRPPSPGSGCCLL